MKKAAAFLLALFVAVAVFISCIYIGENLNHDCCGEDCPICMEISTAEALISHTGVLSVVIAAVAAIRYVEIYRAVKKQTHLTDGSLISLKVELLA